MAGRLVFLGSRGAATFTPTVRAKEALANADVVACPEALDLAGLVPAGCEIARAVTADELVLRARRGQKVVRVSVGPPDEGELLAAACADLDVTLAWLDESALFGKRVLVTRTREQAAGTAKLLRARGAIPVISPSIEIHAPRDPAKLTRAVERMGEALCVVFTSSNGVARTWAEITWQGKDARAFGGAKLAAIGPGTAQALAAHGLTADVVAKEFKQEGLAEELLAALARAPAPTLTERRRIMLLRAEVARDMLPNALRDAGYEVDVVAAYETRAPEPAEGARLAAALGAGEIDVVTFTSSSTVDNLCAILGPDAPGLLGKAMVASIGPITTKTCETHGVRVDVTARTYTLEGLLTALEEQICSIDNPAQRKRS
jgi:uroporphyrinogen III methyltransferase / synthase